MLSSVSRIVGATCKLARKAEEAYAQGNGFEAKSMHTKVATKVYDFLTSMGFLCECTIHADISAVFTFGREFSADGVLMFREKDKKMVFVLRMEDRKQKQYILSSMSSLTSLAAAIWNPQHLLKCETQQPLP